MTEVVEKEKRLTKHEKLLIAQLLKHLPHHRIKHVIAYLQRMYPN